MFPDLLPIGIDRKEIIQVDADRYHHPPILVRQTVTVPPHIDVPIPAHPPHLTIRGVEPGPGKRREMRRLTENPLPDHLLHRPMKPTVRLLLKPPERQVVHVREAIERPVSLEEVVLDVA